MFELSCYSNVNTYQKERSYIKFEVSYSNPFLVLSCLSIVFLNVFQGPESDIISFFLYEVSYNDQNQYITHKYFSRKMIQRIIFTYLNAWALIRENTDLCCFFWDRHLLYILPSFCSKKITLYHINMRPSQL